jgi:hypothetical protein
VRRYEELGPCTAMGRSRGLHHRCAGLTRVWCRCHHVRGNFKLPKHADYRRCNSLSFRGGLPITSLPRSRIPAMHVYFCLHAGTGWEKGRGNCTLSYAVVSASAARELL